MSQQESASRATARTLVREGTTVDDMVRILSEEIVSGQWPPETRLSAKSIADRFGVSRTPVREAFGHLFAMGLVERRPNRGVVTACISESRLLSMFEAMAELEASCAGLCAQRMTLEERRALSVLHESSRTLSHSHSPQAYTDFNDDFHSRLYEGSRSAYLIELTRATRARLQPFRHTQFQVSHRPERSFIEHEAIVDAIVAGDAVGAAEAARRHVLSVGTVSQTFVESHARPDANRNSNS
ncbi:GntR family transcriptional regulator [Phytohalomonas tamaricis]|uniref:GntR family transcriptional regulator n=1 Tax=Phytohalomonas tamaricis TaxID=2081032 RepID=UPI000D0B7EA3|nr:GntR family transcriptional regulator [Phytohalomonas tamaricis]